jgi:electron transfer flavoprotein alpha/beta subunit
VGSILIVAEIQGGKIREASFELASFAQKIAGASGRSVASLVMGQSVGAQADELAKRGGGKVYVAEHELLANYNAESALAAIKAAVAASGADLVLISNTPSGWDVAPRIAAALDAGFVSDCFFIGIEGSGLAFKRRVFNGKLDATIRASSEKVVATVQPGATAPFSGSSSGSVEKLALNLDAGALRSKFVGIPHTTAAVHIARNNGALTVDREIEGGAHEVQELKTPCLVAVQSGLNQVRYASLKGIMAAKKKPLDVKTAADLGLAGKVGAGAAKVKIEKIAPPQKGDRAEILKGSTDDIVKGLVGKIKELGLL